MDEISDYNAVKGDADKLFWVRLKRRLASGLLTFLYVAALPIGVAVWADVNDLDELRNVAVTIVGVAAVFALFHLGRRLWAYIRVLMGGRRDGGTTGAIVLWRKMLSAYDQLEGGTGTNPRRIRKLLARIVREGAGWNANVFPLLDKVIQRSAGRWS